MNITKLHEAFDELDRQRLVIVAAMNHLQQAINALSTNGTGDGINTTDKIAVSAGNGHQKRLPIGRQSHFDYAIKVLTEEGSELHITEIVKRISDITGNRDLTRGSVEGALSRNIREKGQKARLIRTAPSTYTINPNSLDLI